MVEQGMTHKIEKLNAGLYLVATPLGTARDITLRALDILTSCDIIAAEDTRRASKLLDIHGLTLGKRPLWSYHDHSTVQVREKIIEAIKKGKSVAYVSDAGTPLIADPGYQLVRQAQQLGVYVTAAPGPSAVVTALSLGGLPTNNFYFAGFLPTQIKARRVMLKQLSALETTIVLFESPKRLSALMKDICAVISPDVQVSVCRELTKKFEEIVQGTASDLLQKYSYTPPKGEIVVLLSIVKTVKSDYNDIKSALINALLTMRVKDAVNSVAGAFDMSKQDIYKMALKLEDERQKNEQQNTGQTE